MITRWRRWPKLIGPFALVIALAGMAPAQSSGILKMTIAKTSDSTNSQEWNPGTIRLRGVRALDIVTFVNRINPVYLSGKERLMGDRFDVDYESVSIPRATGEGIVIDSILRMLKLQIVKKAMDVDVMVIDKPRKLGPYIRSSYETSNTISIDEDGVTVGITDMDGLARHLESYLLMPVINRTEMKGQFRWEVGFRQGMNQSMVSTEVKSRLGFDLKPARERMTMYVVEPIPTDEG